jgi:hypothetical protein
MKGYELIHIKDVYSRCTMYHGNDCSKQTEEYAEYERAFMEAKDKTEYTPVNCGGAIATRTYVDLDGVDDESRPEGGCASITRKDYFHLSSDKTRVSYGISGSSYYGIPLLTPRRVRSVEYAVDDINGDGAMDLLLRVEDLSGKIFIGVYEGRFYDENGDYLN